MLAALACAALLLTQEAKVPTLPIGAPAPDFDLPGADGRRYTLKDFADKKLLLVVFDTVHCPTSQNYETRLRRLYDDYHGKGVGFIAVSPNSPKGVRLDELGYTDLDDTFESLKLRVEDRKIPYPYCYDGEPNLVSKAYGPKATPHAFLFDAARTLRYQGGIDDSEWAALVKTSHLRNALDALLDGRPVPVAETRVFGCSTKWPEKAPQVDAYNARIAAEPVTVEEPTPEALAALRNPAGKVRLVHVWSTASAESLQPCVTMYHWYRRRDFEFVPVAIEPAEREATVLAALKGTPPAGKNRNYRTADLDAVKKALGWDGTLPLTLVVSPAGEVLYRAQGPVDALACRRAIVRALPEDRMPKRK
ncbi:MAG TPA: redoxin domain-containing protein [Planctomycetota bacterium]|nr:redoxin domain-containing protein [Planctomycetota bacterium]